MPIPRYRQLFDWPRRARGTLRDGVGGLSSRCGSRTYDRKLPVKSSARRSRTDTTRISGAMVALKLMTFPTVNT